MIFQTTPDKKTYVSGGIFFLYHISMGKFTYKYK